MGLSGAFGGKNFYCKACGHAMVEYAPNCPVCLSKNMSPMSNAKAPGPSSSSTAAPTYDDPAARGGSFPLGALAIVIGLLIMGYALFFNKHDEPEPVKPVVKAEPIAPVRRPVVRRPARPAVAVKKHGPSGSAAAAGPSPRKGPAMQLWTNSDD